MTFLEIYIDYSILVTHGVIIDLRPTYSFPRIVRYGDPSDPLSAAAPAAPRRALKDTALDEKHTPDASKAGNEGVFSRMTSNVLSYFDFRGWAGRQPRGDTVGEKEGS